MSKASAPYRDAFLRGLREHGYVSGKDFTLYERFAEGKNERLPSLAAELVDLKMDLIFAGTTPTVSAVQQATGTIPIVFVAVADPVRSGFAVSVARPGRNITGLSNFAGDLAPKRLELLKEMLPKLSRIGLLVNPDNTLSTGMVQPLQLVAKGIGLQLVAVNSRTSEDIAPAISSMARQRLDAVFVSGDAYHFAQRRQISDAAIKNRIASVFPYRECVEAGGLMSYGTDTLDPFRRAAGYVDKILKGAKPGDLPIEQPSKFELAINLKTAKTLGIMIPQSLLIRADQVIE